MTHSGVDQSYLLNDQYKNASNLNKRIQLHARFSTNVYGWHPWVFDRALRAPANARVLEVGCGPGELWRENLDRVPTDWRVTLSDFSPGMLAKAQQNLAALAGRFEFRQLDVQEIPFADGSFELVIANHMLYHVPDIGRGLAEIARVLAPGGRLLAATNGRNHLRQMRDLRVKFHQLHGTGIAPDFADTFGMLTFELSTGAQLLQPHFAQVQLHPYADALRITEVEPLFTYMRSGLLYDVPDAVAAQFGEFLEQEMQAAGDVLHVDKDMGLFEATK
ncbi:MAG: class I SAM-dependent methyltransferase [Caldilineaceae bacterium]